MVTICWGDSGSEGLDISRHGRPLHGIKIYIFGEKRTRKISGRRLCASEMRWRQTGSGARIAGQNPKQPSFPFSRILGFLGKILSLIHLPS
jgi:hypothetical protein